MHINMKYYVVTIGAIFIALGIGMLVGVNLNYDQELSKQQANIIEDLDEKFEGLREKNNDLQESLDIVSKEYEEVIEFIGENLDALISEELSDENIGIISTNENNDYTDQIIEAITRANGRVAFDIVIKNNVYEEDNIEEIATSLDLEIESTQDIINYIIDSLVLDDANERLTAFEELGIIKINYIDEDYKNYDSVVIASGSENEDVKMQFESIDKVISNKLKEEDKNIVAVQKTEHNSSYIDLYTEENVTTVDNINQDIGKLSVVMILKQGNISGNYGILNSADSILPYNE